MIKVNNTTNILVLNGPNLNLLGNREPNIYGNLTITQINESLLDLAEKHNIELQFKQSNAEHEIIDAIHNAVTNQTKFILLNAGAYTHTSIAIRDALIAVDIPFIEIHISNIYKREDFRKQSYFSDIAAGIIAGFGPVGYELALIAAMSKLQQ